MLVGVMDSKKAEPHLTSTSEAWFSKALRRSGPHEPTHDSHGSASSAVAMATAPAD